MYKNNIAFITKEYLNPLLGKSGGIGVFISKHAKLLTMNNYKVTVLVYGSKKSSFTDENVSVIVFKDLSLFFNFLKKKYKSLSIPGYYSLSFILAYINRIYISIRFSIYIFYKNIKLVEMNDYGGDAPFLLTRAKVVIRLHGSFTVLHQFLGYSNRKIESYFEKKLIKRFNKNLIAVSHSSADLAVKSFHLKNKPHVIYNGVKPVGNIADDYFKNFTKKYSLYYFGLVSERKGISIAAEVFNELIDKIPEATFHVIGRNSNNYWLHIEQNILTERAKKSTTYYGAIQNSQIFDCLNEAHVVIFPSYGENFSLALLEVMSLGKVVITSNILSFQEIIKDKENGFIADKKEDYIHAIYDIFTDKYNLNSVSKHASQTIKDNFNSDRIVQENINYYQSLK